MSQSENQRARTAIDAGLSSLRAVFEVSDDGSEVTARIIDKGQVGTAPKSLFDSTEGKRRLVVKLPNSCALKLDWLDGELVGVRVDGAFPSQPASAPTHRRVFTVRQTEKALILAHEPDFVAAMVESSESGAPALLQVEDSATTKVNFDWQKGELAGVRIQGDFQSQVDPAGAVNLRVFSVKHRKNDVALSLDPLAAEATSVLREEIRNAASGVVEAAWQARPPPDRVNAALPLVLIAQIQRSGGTLLSQLFDSHPEVWAFPQELKWGGELKYLWPNVDPQTDGPLRIARSLVAANLEDSKTYNLFGYQKEGLANRDQRLPFNWSEWAYVQAFLDAWEKKPPENRRQCFDIFMSAYFSAFLDWRERSGAKKLITAFTPRVNFTSAYPENNGFFSDYPDGLMISTCRHPSDWYASASRHEVKYIGPGEAMALWRESAESSLQLKKRHPNQVVLVDFTALVSDSRRTMERLSHRLGLTWHPILTIPTFNGMPIASNSSFSSVVGIDPTAVGRRDLVPAGLRKRIEAENLELYNRFTEAADVA